MRLHSRFLTTAALFPLTSYSPQRETPRTRPRGHAPHCGPDTAPKGATAPTPRTALDEAGRAAPNAPRDSGPTRWAWLAPAFPLSTIAAPYQWRTRAWRGPLTEGCGGGASAAGRDRRGVGRGGARGCRGGATAEGRGGAGRGGGGAERGAEGRGRGGGGASERASELRRTAIAASTPGARAAAWRGSDARSPAATAAPPWP